jgi:hypothetical protein
MPSSPKPFVGPLQPVRSRKDDSAVWSATKSRPGPGAYAGAATPACGTQPLSTRSTAAAVPFSALSDKKDGSNILPTFSRGAIYDPRDAAFGAAAMSSRPNAPKTLIGTSSREHATLQYNVFTYTPK